MAAGSAAARPGADPRPPAEAPPPRLARLSAQVTAGGVRIAEATGFRARVLGLAGLAELPAGHALRFARCRSVHTWGMRFALDVIFLDAAGAPVRVERGVGRRRLLFCRRARTVVETSAGQADRVLGVCSHREPAAAR